MSEYKKLEKRFFSYLKTHLIFIKRWVVYTYVRFIQKGKEKLTVMLIPHSEKKIFNFQISIFTISFLIVVLAGVVVTFFISTSRYTLTKKEMVELQNEQEGSINSMNLFKEEISVLNNSVMEYKNNIKDIIKLLGASQSENIFGLGGPETEIKNITEIIGLRNKGDYRSELETIKRINADINASTKVLQNFTKFLAAREEIIQKIPNNWPIIGGGYITSPFGMRRSPFTGNWAMHQGVDMSWWPGAPIRASADGVVVFSGMKGGYGRTIQIQHEYGFQTLYGHLSSITAYEGKQVKKGEIIGFLGRSGRSTGFHLHYEVRIGTKAVDPMIFMTTEF
ncbi:MAG: M23 family metallopeptidase [Spirochaetes bacterium]|nr:M23 family metallopeptidase [Spirochaetota bacterium]MCK5568997.1 M23 family metallopeptidase [Spirochaetota bacterium]